MALRLITDRQKSLGKIERPRGQSQWVKAALGLEPKSQITYAGLSRKEARQGQTNITNKRIRDGKSKGRWLTPIFAAYEPTGRDRYTLTIWTE